MSGKYDRHIQLINYLLDRKREIFENLASLFNVSVKTIKKDINELSLYFPLITYVGRGGGVELKNFAINGYIMNVKHIDLICEGLRLLNKIKPNKDIDYLLDYFNRG